MEREDNELGGGEKGNFSAKLRINQQVFYHTSMDAHTTIDEGAFIRIGRPSPRWFMARETDPSQ
jgi:hypothetical protein